MSDKQRHTILYFGIFFCIILVGFLLVIYRIICLQTFEREELERYTTTQYFESKEIPAERGNILDCNGRLLASSSPTYIVRFDGRVQALHVHNDSLFRRHVDAFAEEMARIVGGKTDAATYRRRMVEAHKKGKLIALSDGRINYGMRVQLSQTAFVRLGQYKCGVQFESRPTRTRQFGVLASRTIGSISGKTGEALNGLEYACDKQLRGKPGIVNRVRTGEDNMDAPIREPEAGLDVVTTLDANLQDIVENRLEKLLRQRHSARGCAILLEAETGRVLALANLERSEKNPDLYYEGDNLAMRRWEPGSTFKTIAMLAALDEQRLRITDTVSISKRKWIYRGLKHSDAHAMDTVLTARSALAVSSNIGLAKLIVRAYAGAAKPLMRRVRQYNYSKLGTREIQGDTAMLQAPNDSATIGKISYGYFVEQTPMQTAAMYNAIANGGRLMEPYLVEEIRSGETVVEHYEPRVINPRIAGPKAIADIRSALHDVVWDNALGTASKHLWSSKAQSKLVPIAGKTGTAQMREHGYKDGYHRITFVGYFPEDKPLYTCLVYIEVNKNESGPYDSGADCGGAVRDIAERVIANTCTYQVIDGKTTFVKKKEK